MFFFVVMVAGIVLAEVFFPMQGVRGSDNLMINRTGCFNESPGERPVAPLTHSHTEPVAPLTHPHGTSSSLLVPCGCERGATGSV